MGTHDIHTARTAFPAVATQLYLDAAHQAPLAVPVWEELQRFHRSALEHAGPKSVWLERVEQVRAGLAGLIGARPEEVAFTKNTSEGMNSCVHGLAWAPGDNVLVLESEHPNNVYAWLMLQSRGLEVRRVPADKAWADAETFAPYVDARTRAIAISHIMFHNGQRNDITGLAVMTRARGVALFVDCMQSIGMVPIDVRALPATALVSGSHKGLLTPQGLGFLWTAEPSTSLPPTFVAATGITGGGEQLVTSDIVSVCGSARRFEAGNLNLAGVHALGGALDLIGSVGVGAIESHTAGLGDQLIAGLDDMGIDLVGPREREHRAPHIYVLRVTHPDTVDQLLDRGVRLSRVPGGIRVSFGMYSNAEDVSRFLGHLATALRTTRGAA